MKKLDENYINWTIFGLLFLNSDVCRTKSSNKIRPIHHKNVDGLKEFWEKISPVFSKENVLYKRRLCFYLLLKIYNAISETFSNI